MNAMIKFITKTCKESEPYKSSIVTAPEKKKLPSTAMIISQKQIPINRDSLRLDLSAEYDFSNTSLTPIAHQSL